MASKTGVNGESCCCHTGKRVGFLWREFEVCAHAWMFHGINPVARFLDHDRSQSVLLERFHKHFSKVKQ